MAEDFLGNEYAEGDIVLYAGMSGRCVQMVKARVLAIREKSVTVEPIDSARWKQHYGKTKYIDTRTGKSFDPHHAKNTVHLEHDTRYRNKQTGEYITGEQYHALLYPTDEFGRRLSYDHAGYRQVCDGFEYVRRVWKDYVKIETVVSKVTLTVLQNIVLVDKAHQGNP